MVRISLFFFFFFLRQSILARFAASQSSLVLHRSWSSLLLFLVTRSTLARALADHTYNKGSNSNSISDPSRGGLSSASPRPLPLIGGHPLPRLTLSRDLGSMVLETKMASHKPKAHYL